MGEGVEDLARMELERGEYLSVVCNKETRDGLSQCIVVLSYRQRRREPWVGQQPHVRHGGVLSALSAVILLLVSMLGPGGNPKAGVSGGLVSHNCLPPHDE